MAKNREPEKPVESPSESGEEEEEEEASSEDIGSQESESESEAEPDLTQVSKQASSSRPPTSRTVQPLSAVKPQQQAASSSDEEEEEEVSGSESESEPDGPGPQVSNIGARKPRSMPSASPLATPAKSTVAKRPLDNKEVVLNDAKKAKKKPEPESSEKKSNDDSKKLLFQRLWSEDDEIAILRGMIEYTSKKKSDPVADLNAFHEFIKKNLHVDVTRTQLQDKIRRLKKKFENNKSKEKQGKERTFSKAHEQRAYELSKSVWGNEAGKETGGEKRLASPKANGSAVKKAVNKKAVIAAENEEGNGSKIVVAVSDEGEKKSLPKIASSSGSGLSLEERIAAAGAELFEAGTGLEGERQWKKLRTEEIEVHLRMLEVKAAQARLVLDVLKFAEH